MVMAYGMLVFALNSASYQELQRQKALRRSAFHDI